MVIMEFAVGFMAGSIISVLITALMCSGKEEPTNYDNSERIIFYNAGYRQGFIDAKSKDEFGDSPMIMN